MTTDEEDDGKGARLWVGIAAEEEDFLTADGEDAKKEVLTTDEEDEETGGAADGKGEVLIEVSW